MTLASEFLEEAQRQLKKYGKTKKELNLRQACEKGWGTVAQALKVVNPEIKRHAEFGKTAAKLAREYNNEKIMYDEAFGEHLHRAGFYEGLLGVEEIKYGLSAVEDFLKSIDSILSNGGKV